MTEPPAWPEIDEDLLRAAGDAFDAASTAVSAQIDSVRQQHIGLFAGVGFWSGDGANKASSALESRIQDLEGVKAQLDEAARFFDNAVGAVVGA